MQPPSPVRGSRLLAALLAAGAVLAAARTSETREPQPPAAPSAGAPGAIPWEGSGAWRLLLEVPPRDLGDRPSDRMPAEIELDWDEALATLGAEGRVDVGSIELMRIERDGRPARDGDYGEARPDHPEDRAFRWYDSETPYLFPETPDALSRTKDQPRRKSIVRGGYFYNVLGGWRRGRLAWDHTQLGDEPSRYAVYFDLLPAGQPPRQLPPRGWIGDGMPRCDVVGRNTTSSDHCRLDVDDWDGDGLLDLIVGEHYGHVLVWPNLGSRQQPLYRYAKFVQDGDLPLDCGLGAAPKSVDWDGDGDRDLLVGTHWNRIALYDNQGGEGERRLVFQGPLQTADGQTLELPVGPLAAGEAGIFRRDYYPTLETADWDGDGDLDLLAGGYVTGRIFLYENTGRDAKNRPQLRLRGPLLADGAPLNVGHWCASPCAADFDGDGDLDLMTGNMPMYVPSERRRERPHQCLQYFENVGPGGDGAPQLERRDFPSETPLDSWPALTLATPRAADWDGDGDLDLAVSARPNLYLFENLGTVERPSFHLHSQHLQTPWGQAPIQADQFRDWNGDGRLDLVKDYTIHLKSPRGNPYLWPQTESALAPGERIEHPSHIGDDWFWPFLDDLDQDGAIDILFGDWWGHVWWHRKLSLTERRFDRDGFRLQLTTGERIKVGPIGRDAASDFDALQGARTVLAVDDFDRDGRRDLVLGDTFGKVRVYRNVDTDSDGRPRFAAPTEVGDLGIRLLVDAADWNDDGWADIVAGAANGKVRVFLNRGAAAPGTFADGIDPQLPPLVQPRVLVADLNSDGDQDLFVPSTQGACLVERSFLRGGYAVARQLRVERRPAAQRRFRAGRALAAAQAFQGVAVDTQHLYAIDSRDVAKYDKRTGKQVAVWERPADSPLKHLNSGVVVDGKLYCAHSTWPAMPCQNSIEVWDVDTLQHLARHPLPVTDASATWIDRHEGQWWIVYARYGQPEEVAKTRLAALDDQWQERARWRFPDEVTAKFAPYSNSGGSWGPDGQLYVTGHDRGEVYALRRSDENKNQIDRGDNDRGNNDRGNNDRGDNDRDESDRDESDRGNAAEPKVGALELTATLPAELEGQGVAWDRSDVGILYGIRRRSREIVAQRWSHEAEYGRLREPEVWQRDPRNPILPPAEPFDQGRAMNPWVLRQGSQYELYYSGADREGRQRLCVATAEVTDLSQWRRRGPLLETGAEGAFDARWCVLPHVVSLTPDRWHLYYTGNAGRGAGLSAFPGIGLAVSSDRKTWRRHSTDPVLRPSGEPGSGDAIGIAGGSLLRVDGPAGKPQWWFYYTGCPTVGRELALNQQKTICLAVSDDGVQWTKLGPVMIRDPQRDYEDIAVAGPVVRRGKDGGFRMWYSAIGTRWGYYSIAYAESEDGRHWRRGARYGDNLQLTPQGKGWEAQMVEYPTLIEENGQLRMFYCGNGYGKTGIGTAISVKR